MRHLDLQKFVFRINLVITAIVFFLLTPTVRVYQSWFPDKKDSLWVIPVAVVLVSSSLWLLSRLAIPYFIRKGWMKELRQEVRPQDPLLDRFLRFSPSAALTSFHLLLLILCSASVVRFLQHEPFKNLFINLP